MAKKKTAENVTAAASEKTAEETKDAEKVEESKNEGDSKAEEGKNEEAISAEDDPNAIREPSDPDVLSGRGASVNAHPGNKKFRALCFARKPEFEAGNHAAKRRVATEIVNVIFDDGKARFLKKKDNKGPWFEMTKEQAILKACQVMRDYKRPDRMAERAMMQQNGNARKRSRNQEPSTPLLDTPIPTGPLDPIIENPYGVHDHDILSGRGAFVNGHVGNQRLRKLALERKASFDSGNYSEKRALATEIVEIIRALVPPGRFLKRVTETDKSKEEGKAEKEGLSSEWEELPDERAIHKACQVMRDIDRPDRKDREVRKAKKKQKKDDAEKKDSAMDVLAKTTAEKAAVEEAVAATEEALDKALTAADKPEVTAEV